MERCLSLEALNEASHSHYTRGASNKLENMGNTNTSSFHLGITSSPDPPAVEREKIGLVQRAQGEFLAYSKSTSKISVGEEQISCEGDSRPTTRLFGIKINSQKGLPPANSSRIARAGGEKRYSIFLFFTLF